MAARSTTASVGRTRVIDLNWSQACRCWSRNGPRLYCAPMTKVGGEADAWCTKCEMVLAHTVIAMVGTKPVKVECNTCHGVHKYRAAAPGSGPSVSSAARSPKARATKVVISFED